MKKTHANDNMHKRQKTGDRPSKKNSRPLIHVDVIIPVYNASTTIEEAVQSALKQRFPLIDRDEVCRGVALQQAGGFAIGGCFEAYYNFDLDVAVCCHNDASTDDSWTVLQSLLSEGSEERLHEQEQQTENQCKWKCGKITRAKLYLSTSSVSGGAGHARNMAASLRRSSEQSVNSSETDTHLQHKTPETPDESFVCMLDSDDIMLPTRLVEQVAYFLSLPKMDDNNSPAQMGTPHRDNVLLGCQFQRDPPNATWHYTTWLNHLSPKRLYLEQFREVPLLQPTWMLTRKRFEMLGGYLVTGTSGETKMEPKSSVYRLQFQGETQDTKRLAEDVRFLHAHLDFNTCTSQQMDNYAADTMPPRGGHLHLLTLDKALNWWEEDNDKEEENHPLLCPPQADSLKGQYMALTNGNENPKGDTKEFVEKDFISSSGTREFCVMPKFDSKAPRPVFPLVVYRHGKRPSPTASEADKKQQEKTLNEKNEAPKLNQSARTSRTLLLQLRLRAFEDRILRRHWMQNNHHDKKPFQGFAIWGAGRDAKAVLKHLSLDLLPWVKCLLEIDPEKIGTHYVNRQLSYTVEHPIPILHFSDVSRREADNKETESFCEPNEDPLLDKQNNSLGNKCVLKKRKKKGQSDKSLSSVNLQALPILVCVAMYRSNGALERNVKSVGRKEGVDLWHFS